MFLSEDSKEDILGKSTNNSQDYLSSSVAIFIPMYPQILCVYPDPRL